MILSPAAEMSIGIAHISHNFELPWLLQSSFNAVSCDTVTECSTIRIVN